MDLGFMMRVGPMLSKYGKMAPSALTQADVTEVATALGFKESLTSDSTDLALAVLRSSGINEVADLLGRPELIARVINALKPPAPVELVRSCPHCGNHNLVEVDGAAMQHGSIDHVCRHCTQVFSIRLKEE